MCIKNNSFWLNKKGAFSKKIIQDMDIYILIAVRIIIRFSTLLELMNSNLTTNGLMAKITYKKIH